MGLNVEQGLARVVELGGRDHFLATLVTTRADGEPSVSVINAGVFAVAGGEPAVAFVSRGGTAKLANLRRHPRATLVFRAGWEWVAVHGDTRIVGPDDPAEGVDAEGLRVLLRDVYVAAGGVHPDFDEYDRVMAADRRAVVFVSPGRFSTNPVS